MREHHRELLVFAGAAVGNRDAAQDVVQEAFLVAWRKFDAFDHRRDFGAWMRGIVRNKIKDWFRRQQREPVSELDVAEMELDLATWQSARESGSGIFEIIHGCIGKLPGNYKQAVRTFYFEDHEGEAAAESRGISPATLRKRLQRARALLHDCIATHTQPKPEESHV